MNEITYSPGRLAKKIGVSRNTVKNHLYNSGLISQCYRSQNGYLQIPYRVAALMSSAEALAIREPQEPRHQPKPQPVAREESVALKAGDSALSSTKAVNADDNIAFQHQETPEKSG